MTKTNLRTNADAYTSAMTILGNAIDELELSVGTDWDIPNPTFNRAWHILRNAMEYLHNDFHGKPHTSPTDEELQRMIIFMELTA